MTPSEPVWRIKRLVWFKPYRIKAYRAATAFGGLEVRCLYRNRWGAYLESIPLPFIASTKKAAQAAAQAWFRERMAGGLDEVTV